MNHIFTKMDERIVCKESDLLIVTSEQDGASFKKHYPEVSNKISVIPNFIDSLKLKQMLSYDDEGKVENNRQPTIILPASMDYFPNITGALHFHKYMYPLLKRQIVGRGCPPEIESLAAEVNSIIVTGYVPSVHDYIRKADYLRE